MPGAEASATVVDGVITEITVDEGGTGYTTPIITITDEPVPPVRPAWQHVCQACESPIYDSESLMSCGNGVFLHANGADHVIT